MAKQPAATQTSFPPLFAVIRVEGPDAAAFLHAQTTSDVKSMDESSAQFTAYLSPQGRVLALLVLCRTKAGYLALVAPDLRARIVQRLKMFVLRSKVTIEADDNLRVFGRQRAEELETNLGRLPIRCRDPLVIAWPGSRELLVSRSPDDRSDLPWDDWLAEDILLCIPHVNGGSQDRHVAQMLNLEDHGVISFSKGCYPGQEIVARAHYLGRVKRHLASYRVATGAASGTPLLLEERSVGEVVVTTARQTGGFQVAQAVVSDASRERVLHDADGLSYEPVPLACNEPNGI